MHFALHTLRECRHHLLTFEIKKCIQLHPCINQTAAAMSKYCNSNEVLEESEFLVSAVKTT